MPVALIVQLLTTFGPSAVQLIDVLIAKWQTNGAVTPEEWAALRSSAQQTAKDRMAIAIAKAGIDANSPQGQSLLNAAS